MLSFRQVANCVTHIFMREFVSRKLMTFHPRDIRAVALLFVLCALLWLPMVVGLAFGYWPIGEDALAFFVPMREFAHHALREGTLPLWNPYTFGGMPFMANSQIAFWYPPNWLLGFLPSHWALICDLWLHTLLMSVGGYVLARSLGLSRPASFLVAVILSLSSPITARAYAGHMTWQAARAYFPWMLWATWSSLKEPSRIWWLRLVVFAALCILAGHPPMLLLGFGLCAGLVGYWILRSLLRDRNSLSSVFRAAVYPVSALFFSCLLAACALLPMRELAGWTVHGSQLSFRESAVLSGTWKTILRLIAPEWFGGNRGFQWSQSCCAHEESAYIGILPFFLVILAPFLLWPIIKERFRVLALWGLLLLCVLMALGANAPLYRLAWELFPPLHMTRVPTRWLEVWYFGGALLTGIVFWRVFGESRTQKLQLEYSQTAHQRIRHALTACAFFFLVLAAFVMLSPDAPFWQKAAIGFLAIFPGENRENALQNFRNAALFESLTVVILCGIALSLLGRWQRAAPGQKSGLRMALVGFTVLNLLLVGWRSAKIISANELAVVRWPQTIVTQHQPGQRWATRVYWYAINDAASHQIPVVTGYDPLGTKRFFNYASAAEGRKLWNTHYQPASESPLWRVAGVTHTVAQKAAQLGDDTRYPETRNREKVVEDGEWELWKESHTWPAAYATTRVIHVAEDEQLQTLERLASSRQKITPVVVAPGVFEDVVSSAAVDYKTEFRTLNQASFFAQGSQASVFVWNEAAFPGWRAWVNEKPVAVQPANYLFQAVQVPKGEAKIRFVYDSQTTRLAMFLSLMAGMFLIVSWVSRRQSVAPYK